MVKTIKTNQRKLNIQTTQNNSNHQIEAFSHKQDLQTSKTILNLCKNKKLKVHQRTKRMEKNTMKNWMKIKKFLMRITSQK